MEQTLSTAQSLLLTFWITKILVTWGHIDLICDDHKKCEIKLKGLEYILKEKNELPLKPSKVAIVYSPDKSETDDSFIKKRDDVDFKTKVRLDFLPKFEALSISPVTHTRRKAIKSEIKNQFFCKCKSCFLCSMNFIHLEVDLLRCFYLVEKGLIVEANKIFTQLKVLFDSLTEDDDIIETSLWLKCYSLPKDVFDKIMPKSYASFVIKLLIKQAVHHYKNETLHNAKAILDEAESLLNNHTKTSMLSCPNLFALISYQKVIFQMKSILVKQNQENDYTSSHEISFKETPLKEICFTPAAKKIPSIICTNSFNDSISLSICKAPVKKRILPLEVKEALDSISSVPESLVLSPFNYNEAPEHDNVFATPAAIFKKSTPVTRRKKKLLQSKSLASSKEIKDTPEQNEKCYKFFTSKSQSTHISSSKEIWSSSQNVETIFAYQCSTPAKKNLKNQKAKKTKTRAKSKRTVKKSSNSNSELLQSQNDEIENKLPEPSFEDLLKSSEINNKSVEFKNEESFNASDELFPSPPLEAIEKLRQEPRSRKNNGVGETLISDMQEIKTVTRRNTRLKEKSPSELNMSESEQFQSPRPTISKIFAKCKTEKKSLSFALQNLNISEKNINFDDIMKILKDSISAVAHFPPYPLFSDLCKTLALLILNQNRDNQNDAFTVAYLLSQSFAVTLKSENDIFLTKKFFNKNALPGNERTVIYPDHYLEVNSSSIEDTDYRCKMESLLNNVPENWTILQICVIEDLCSSVSKKSLCVSRFHRNSIPYTKLFELPEDGDINFFLAEFERIRQENVISTKSSQNNLFWKLRLKLNDQLRTFITDMCTRWFGGWKGLFLGLSVDENRRDQINNVVDTLLKSLPRKNDREMLYVLADSAKYLNKNELSSVICNLWNIKKSEDSYKTLFKCIQSATTESNEIQRHPVILILDKDIQHLPWENMPIIKNQATVREPSLYFLNYQLSLHMNKVNSVLTSGVDSKDTFYLLNPQGDMTRTQKCFEDTFMSKMNWSGISGRGPTMEEFQNGLTNYNLFLYLGHGSGSTYLKKSIEASSCKASAIIMGCNSGRLKKPGRQLEATGDALKHYYLAGCPCIIGNLWEVTDKDIDLFTKVLLETWIPHYDDDTAISEDNKMNIADAVAKARDICRLRFLNGAAPVIYGLPLFAKFEN